MSLTNIVFEIKMKDALTSQDSLWLEDLARLRAEAFYIKGPKGPRSAFKLDNGEFNDPDTHDMNSHHILAFEQKDSKKTLAGAVRLLPLAAPKYHCVASEIVGDVQFHKLMDFFNPSMKLMEVNRFFVREEFQHHVLGMNLCAAAWWLGHSLGYQLITNGNIKLVESLYLKHLGGMLFPEEAGPYSSEFYNDDEIYILYIDKHLASEYLLARLEDVKPLLPSVIPAVGHEVAITS